jgi:cell division protease FtsH
VSYAAVQNSGFSDTNLVGRVLGDSEGRRRVEELLQRQKVVVRGLLETHAHLVAALRDALVERHELIGTEITDVLEQAMASRPLDRIDLGDSSQSDETSQSDESDGGAATIDLRADRPAVAED